MGLSVPKNEKHVIYVWLDALTNYISALNFPNTENKKYKDFWPADIHIIGKDILSFMLYFGPFCWQQSYQCPKVLDTVGYFLMIKNVKIIRKYLDPLEMIEVNTELIN